MTNIYEYSRQGLETKLTEKLGTLYMNYFMLRKKFPEAEPQLDLVTELLAARSVTETVNIHRYLQTQLKLEIAHENYERAAELRNIIFHCRMHILG